MTDILNVTSRYSLQSKLGEGGMGVVYRATDRLTGQPVALKQVTATGDQLQFASQSTDQDFRLSLAQEFRTLAGLHHPHIVAVLDYGFNEQHQPFFTMQLIENAQELTGYASSLLETESLAIGRELHLYDATLISLINLSLIALAEHNPQEADAWLKECLQLAHSRQVRYFLVAGLANKVSIWFQQGNIERSVEVAGFVIQHPMKDKEMLDIIDQNLEGLQTKMTPEAYHLGLERGKTLDLDTLIAEILAEA